MTALQVYAILSKKIRGLVSGIKSAAINGTTITFTMNDNSVHTMTFPTPTDGISVTNIEIKQVIIDNIIEKHLIFTMSDGNSIDSGKLEGFGGGVVQKEKKESFPSVGDTETLYLAKDSEEIYYWDGAEYRLILSDSTNVSAKIKTANIEFDGINDRFNLPEDNISYNVFVNGLYYTEYVDYDIDRSVSPNQIVFNEIYDSEELCTLTYFKTVPSSESGENCNCSELDFADKKDIDELFQNDNLPDISETNNYATKEDIDKMFEGEILDGNVNTNMYATKEDAERMFT